MEENTNNTVKQLSQALNQLLDAYEKLQGENGELKEQNGELKETIQDLEVRNAGLNSRLTELSDTTKHQSSEMTNMLSRISTILPGALSTSSETSEKEEVINEEAKDESIEQKEEETNLGNSTALDLDRMQSLLNGLNN